MLIMRPSMQIVGPKLYLQVAGFAEAAEGSHVLADWIGRRTNFRSFLGPHAELVVAGQGESSS